MSGNENVKDFKWFAEGKEDILLPYVLGRQLIVPDEFYY